MELEMASYARPKFVLYGASMTEFSFCHGGWGAALADLYCRKADIVLRGYRGWNTRRALEAVDKIFPKDAEDQPELVVVFFGANDAAFPMPSGRGQHVSLPEFEDNLCRIVAYLQGLSDKTRVILTTAPPIYEAARLKWARARYGEKGGKYVDRTNDRAGQYAAACRSAAQKMGAGNIDLWTSIQRQPGWQTACLSDGMHLSAQGSAVMLEELLKVLKDSPWQPSLHYDAMSEDLSEPSLAVHPSEENVEVARVLP